MNPFVLLRLRLAYFLERKQLFADLARAFRRQEPLRSFLEGEIDIARKSRLYNRLALLKALKRRLGTDAPTNDGSRNAGQLYRLFASIAPDDDLLILHCIDKAGDRDRPEALASLASAAGIKESILARINFILLASLGWFFLFGLIVATTLPGFEGIAESFPKDVQASVWRGEAGTTRDLAYFFRDYWPLLTAFAVAAVALMVYGLPRFVGPARAVLDRVPGFTLYRDLQGAMLLMTLGLMLRSGLTLPDALGAVEKRSRGWTAWRVGQALRALERNSTGYMDALSQGLINRSMEGRLRSAHRSEADFGKVVSEVGCDEMPVTQKKLVASATVIYVAIMVTLLALGTFISFGPTFVSVNAQSAMNSSMYQTRGK